MADAVWICVFADVIGRVVEVFIFEDVIVIVVVAGFVEV